MDWVQKLFDTSDFPARWHCGNWSPEHGWLHIVSDTIIFLCYMIIPIALVWFKRHRSDFPYSALFVLFAAFILSCGMTHAIEAIIFWAPIYRVSGLAKALTASASVATVAYLFPTLPKLFALRSPFELEKEIEQRLATEAELKQLRDELEQIVEQRTRELDVERQRLALALKAGAMGVWDVDLDTGRVRLDSRAQQMLGLTGDERQLDGVLDQVHSKDRPKLREAFASLQTTHTARIAAQFRLKDPNGDGPLIEARIAPAREAVGGPLLVVSWDGSTARQEKVQNRRLLEILEATPDFVATATVAGQVVWQNMAMTRYFAALAAGGPRRLAAYFAPDQRERIVDSIIPSAIRDGIWIGESALVRDDHRVEVSQVVLAHENGFGDVTHVSTIMRDVSEQKQREAQLVAGNERLRAAVAAAPNAMAMVDSKGAIRLHNDEFLVLFGYSAEEMSSLTVDALLPTDLRAVHAGHRQGYLDSPSRRPMGGDRPLYGLHKNGRLIPLEIGLNPLELHGERLTLVAIVNISERLRAREAIEFRERHLQQVNEDLQEFAYAASHDLQEPLRKVTAFCQLLELELADDLPPKAKEYIELAVDGATRMQVMVKDLLEYSRIGGSAVRLEEIDVAECVQYSLDALSGVISECDAEIVVDERLPRIRGQQLLCRRVFVNLIGNALKYRRAGVRPRVEVTVRPQGTSWRFSVSDNGIGIAPQHQERVFNLFQRLHGRDEYPGSGIGLAVVKKSIERCGGRIWLESEVGVGTQVHFLLEST